MNAYLHDMNDDLLVKYLLGEASAGERKEVERWVAADAGNRRYFDHFKFIWEESKKLAATSTVDEDQAWHRFQQRTGRQPTVTTPAVVRSMDLGFNWFRIAMIFIISVGALGLIYLVWNVASPAGQPQQITFATTNTTQADTLPDGSIVTLNKKSALSYPTHFKGNNRPVELKGEAFFRITPDKNKPFVVRINDITVTVVGTSFNVKSIGGKTEVVVETGIVQVSKAQQTVELKPKEKLVVTQKDSVLTKETVTDQLYKYYRTREFVCDDTPLWKLVEVLNEAYDVNIVIERKELRSLTLSAPFYDEPIDRIIDLILDTFNNYNIQVERKGSTIILK